MTPDDWKRVKAIASEAWAQPASARLSYIASACQGDDFLNREVSSLVAAMDGAGDRFDIPPPLPVEDMAAFESLAGRRIGAYEILSPIGAGGMGEVYKARDTRLNRFVAIKALPARASADRVSRERMEREARAVAALKHPHICTLYDVGTHDGLDFLVMEYLDGETLAARLLRGRLPLAEALRYAEQIASALLEAHRAGIVHRDVKPANIMLDRVESRSDAVSQAKLLDFGVAKADPLEILSVSIPAVETPLDLTLPGFVLGTAQYMAPEQVAQRPADVRSDIFAFGAVLFEMLTGRKAFEGTDRAQILATIRDEEAPRASTLRPDLPAAVDRLVARCLARSPEKRYQSFQGVLVDIRAVQRRLDSSSRARVLAFAIAAAVAVIAGAAAWMAGGRREAAPVVAPSLTRLAATAGVRGAAALSPDGTKIVFSWSGESITNPELVLLPVGGTSRVRLTNDSGVEEWPAWSPDGTAIAFIRCGTRRCGIFTLPVSGGPERKLLELRDDRYFGLAWAADGRSIVYAQRPSSSDPYAMFVLSLDTSRTRQLTTPPPGLGDLRFALSPDGTSVAVVRLGDRIGVHLVSIETASDTALLSGQREWFGGVTWSADGRHLILSANQNGVRRLWRLPVAGGELQQVAIAGEDSYFPAVSARGDRLVFVHEFRDWDLSRVTLNHGAARSAAPLPSSTRLDLDPAFSPDDRSLAFVSERGGTREIWVSNADGTGARQLTSLGGPTTGRPSWSPDGRFLAFHGEGINVMPATGGALRKVSADGEVPTWSADGRSIYFIRYDTGRYSIWKVAAEGGTAVQVITTEASIAHEAPNGSDLYFVVHGGIRRIPAAGGEEVAVIPDFDSALTGYWQLVSDGIYYVARDRAADNTVVNRIKFFDFARRHSAELGTLPGAIDDYVGGLTVSSDRRSLIYSHRTYETSEVMLVEHFR